MKTTALDALLSEDTKGALSQLQVEARAELKAIQAQLAAMVELLKEIEWAGSDDWGNYCPACRGYNDLPEKHIKGCKLEAALKGTQE